DGKNALSESMSVFYSSCIDTLTSVSEFIQRLARASESINPKSAECLKNIACNPPKNTYEAMQLILIFFVVYEFVLCGRLRTLGRLDEMFLPFYKNDLENGTFTKDQIKELFKYFLCRFHAMKIAYDQPLLLGGIDRNGNEVTNELSYMIVEAYNELNIHSPKIHIRVSDKTPESFVKLVLSCIRGGNSSFVFACDNTVIRSLTKLGMTECEARDYVLIGCYEAAIWGIEVPCTGSGRINLAKCAELAMNGGKDMATGKQIGRAVGKIRSYKDFETAVKEQISYLSAKTADYIRAIESLYPDIYPDPLLSSMLDNCVECGTDAYAGGAKYNNSSINFAGIATLTDIMAAVKKVVFEEKRISFEELCTLMKNNWRGAEKLRLYCGSLKEKYGNGNKAADDIARDMAKHTAQSLNGIPNGRGGYFKAGLFSIDNCFPLGEKTAATPDGRYAGEPLSKNLCSTTAKDRNGITALAQSVAAMDLSDFSNGSVLDVIMHPTAVSGEDGLCAMYGVLKTFFDAGGFAMHGNVFDAKKLREAQENPEKHSTLQVRVCGWNAYFVNLSKKEQDEFIKQTEHIS
ncbi:MAG: hypothetical protein IKV97_05945, partial [Clostridia bacterium]|nr:hypothetical protein [Clostridia bacterium]